ncbi:PRC-barrel domain-containing protein [Aurantimonas sp. HBX-1]|uniref:PRC-barrel domain-containing protein n=1 Tax=Aurantimonas sp. HBX-1 TaxID=2906072 RepID=UPI001F3008D7|nr:PRC-barrel domain-containing protein [Aurantimonas sp. HBX-1]UIJ72911.1 PRC-barrel domain-containing protein [Aurantimonas sp. HBX-1]
MMRKLFATTALAGILATSAYAQDKAPANATPVAPDATVTIDTDAAAPTAAAETQAGQMQSLTADQHLASDLVDLSIYQSAAAEAASIGEIENFLLDADGKVAAAVVEMSAGGEDRTVAIPFDQITWSNDENNQPRAVLNVGVEQLAQAPEFVDPEDQADAADAVAVNGAPATGTASAPAATGTDQAAVTPPATATGTDAGTEMAAGTDAAPAATGEYASQAGAEQFLADNLMSAEVKSGPGDDADEIGTISDLIMASDGRVEAAVIGVGGFLGIGEKDVAVPFDQLQMTRDDDNDLVVATAMTREQLEQAPAFEVSDDNATMAAGEPAADTAVATGAMTGAATTTATTDTANTETTAPVGGADMAQGEAAVATTGTADTTTTASTGGEREGMTAVTDQSELTADNLLGATVYGPNEENVGDIADIALSPEGQVDAVIVDVGGFLGIGAKPVAVAMDNLQFMQDSSGSLYLYTQFTQEQLEAAPEYDADSYADNRDTMRIQSGGAGQPATAN